jgi:hypothetical protein
MAWIHKRRGLVVLAALISSCDNARVATSENSVQNRCDVQIGLGGKVSRCTGLCSVRLISYKGGWDLGEAVCINRLYTYCRRKHSNVLHNVFVEATIAAVGVGYRHPRAPAVTIRVTMLTPTLHIDCEAWRSMHSAERTTPSIATVAQQHVTQRRSGNNV